MVIIRSTFWLVVAFMVIGPRVDIPASIADLSRNATQETKSFVEQQTDISTCKSIDCVSTRIVLSAGAQAVSDFVTPLALPLTNNTIQEQTTAKGIQLSPHPRPRILRSS